MEMRDSLIRGRVRLEAPGPAQAAASGHPGCEQRQPFASSSSAGSVARIVGRAVSMMFSRGDEIRPYRSCASHLKDFVPLPIVGLLVGCVVATAGLATFGQPDFQLVAQGSPCIAAGPLGASCSLAPGADVAGDCAFGLTESIAGRSACPLQTAEYRAPAPSWKAYLVMNSVALAIGAIVMGAPVAPTILVTNVVFVYAKVVTEKQAFAGFGSPSVVALAILFVLSAAVERSGLLEPLVDGLMGDGSNPTMSRLRLIVPAMLLSGFVSNTPLCAMLLPFAVNWAERRGLEPFDYLMPLAFATNIGGALTQIGSPPNLVVFERVARGHDMGMFYQAPLAALCCAAFAAYTVALGPWMLRASVQPRSLEKVEKPEAELYTLRWQVLEDSELVGSTWASRGLLRLGSARLKRVSGATGDLAQRQLRAGDGVVTVSDAADAARLRRVRGLLLAGGAGEAARRLGARRRRRCLFECVLRPGVGPAALAPGEDVDLRGAVLKTLGAAVIGYRGVVAPGEDEPVNGRIALVEGDDGGFEAKADRAFAMVRKVPGSTPPRVGRHADPIRAWASVAIVLAVIVVCVLISLPALRLGEAWLSPAPLASLSIIAAALIVALDILTLKEALGSVNVQAFIGIAASVGWCNALETTGVARLVAGGLVAAAKAAGCGALGVSAALLLAGCLLSNVVTDTAVAALMMPIAETIAAEEGIDVRILGSLVILASNFALATPFACATNLMVMAPLGPGRPSYSFGDYVRFGLPLQALLAATALLGVRALYGPMDAVAAPA